MRLLQKTNRAYFLISGIALLIAGVIIYFVLSFFFKDQLNENLKSDIDDVKLSIEKNRTLPDYYPFIEAREVLDRSEHSYETVDTLIFDSSQKENIPFRQISIVTSINGKRYLITARDTLFEQGDLLTTIAIVIGSVFLLLLVSLYFINRRLSLIIWKPFYGMLNELKEFSHDRPGFLLTPVSQPDEFTELNQTLEKLTNKVISDYQSLKRFTEDASHEIQTPLAVIQSKLEILMQSPDLKKDQAELINSIYVYNQRISKLTQTLLLLTKIANDQFPEKRAVNMSELLEEKLQSFADNFSEKSLTVKKSIEPKCVFETNFFLAESLIINLVGNALKHTNNEGTVYIILDKNHFEISNSGDPVSVPSSKLFERFYKINRSSDSQGLGLSIVKEICTLNKWDVKYVYKNDMHKFIIRF